jgi:hypothetical protein
MLTESEFAGSAVPANAGEQRDESGAALLAWMEELESSLLGSHRALLKLDLAGIERETSEQAGLIGKFDVVRRQSGGAFHLTGHSLTGYTTGWERELRSSVSRILEATRLQAALLARAQAKLRVLANMLAGPSVDYGPFLARRAAGATGMAIEAERLGMRRRREKCRA